MYECTRFRVKVRIELENGIYIFDNKSAIGKTRLCKLLREYQRYKEPVASYTYADKQVGIDIKSVLDAEKYNVIMLDRYDMYTGDGAEDMLKCAKSSVILIDCKGKFEITNDVDWCTIEMSEDSIEVVG